MGYQITFDGFGFNDANDQYKRRLATLPATWKDEGARQQFGHEVVRAVNSHADLLAALHLIGSQSIGDDWTHEQAYTFMKETARAAIAKAKEGL